MRVQLSIPARVNILGNPADGNEGDFATISAAVDLRARVVVDTHTRYSLEQQDSDDQALVFSLEDLPLRYTGSLDLVKGAINRLFSYSAEFREKLPARGFYLRIKSDVPRQSGLGGSSLFVLLTLAAFRQYYDLDPNLHNNYVLSEIAQRVEAKELGITCGYADRYVPLFGGLAYLDYRGKLFQVEVGKEPFVTYERLDEVAERLCLVAITSGIHHDSGDIHGRMRSRYLEEFKKFGGSRQSKSPMIRFMTSIWECAWQGKIALLANDLQNIGRLMNENHRLVDEMMRYCGFEDGAGDVNNKLIKTAQQEGALGAKLTGAGGGGSVFALSNPGEEEAIMQAWRRAAEAYGLGGATVYPLRISKTGLQMTEA